jgi:hypothetical protein
MNKKSDNKKKAELAKKMAMVKTIQASVRQKLGPNPPKLTKDDYDALYE